MEENMLTSGYNLEGYRIIKYLGFCSGECALGTGIFSSFDAGVADILGESSVKYEEKLSRAKSMAISALKTNAQSLGANAIIGLDVNYTAFTSDIMGVVAKGTAVIMEKIVDIEGIQCAKYFNIKEERNEGDNNVNFPIINFYPELSFRPFNISFDIKTKEIQISIYNYTETKLSAMNVDIIANTIFGTQYEYADINFVDCVIDAGVVKTEKVFLNIPFNQLKTIVSVSIKIKHYISDEDIYSLRDEYKISKMSVKDLVELRKSYGNDVMNDFSEDVSRWYCMCGNENVKDIDTCSLCGRRKMIYGKSKRSGVLSLSQIFPQLADLKNCAQMYNYLISIEREHDFHSPEEVMKELKKLSDIERMYGNMKDSGIRILEKYISENE